MDGGGGGGGGEHVIYVIVWAQMAPKKSRCQGPPLPMAHVMDIARIKIITSRAIKTTGTFIVIMAEPIQKTPILHK
jgi:hypothetical protein